MSPQTTTAINGCDLTVKIDNSSGVLQDVSGTSNQIRMDRSLRISDDVYTFGTKFPIVKTCGKKATISARFIYSQDEAEAIQLLNDWYENHSEDPRTVQIDMPDSLPGSDRYTYEALLENLNVQQEAGDANPTLVEATFRPTGTFSWANISS
jgi:hypothetical protein